MSATVSSIRRSRTAKTAPHNVPLCPVSWIEWFCQLKQNIFLVEVDEDFIRDEFNLIGLQNKVPHFKKLLKIILDEDDDDDDDDDEEDDYDEEDDEINRDSEEMYKNKDLYEQNAGCLYGLIHSRFILTSKGLALMREKYKSGIYGTCPSIYCDNSKLLPTAISEVPKFLSPLLYCPRCCETFYPHKTSLLNQLDGAYFGTSFASFFALSFNIQSDKKKTFYTPQICGFTINRDIRETLYMDMNKDNSESSEEYS
ncbi:casein kinase II beta chain [Plasmodium ovale wallikeri]|uniref:Casein kinase II subunit beta n=1 Tax=Plasmodium ovale wallikeri TaxID=864142 RepID=A0A1A8ZLP7_PLAOA|nr:casein kinase II beta chain [Plasmodium ovale wallikeri]SBT44795.1 casein kinase II beta chain [Plasmodium ovale wallikeri]